MAVFALLFAVVSHETPHFAYILCCAGLCLYGTSSGLVHGPLEVRLGNRPNCPPSAAAQPTRAPTPDASVASLPRPTCA